MIYDLNRENCVKEVMYKMDLLENMELQLGYFKQLGQLHLYTPAAEM